MRNISDYSEKYLLPGFETYKVFYRRKKLLEIIEKRRPENILEIGCGCEPLFQYVHNAKFTVVEPSDIFFIQMVALADKEKQRRVKCIQAFFEEIYTSLSKESYDMIICSSLLHEVESPEKLLQAMAGCANENTVIHINVPNANSMHRLLGRAMGILSNIHDKSESNMDFQQNNIFDIDTLKKIVHENGFEVFESGSFFVKPFSHAQMYDMMQKGIIDDKVLDGLYSLGKDMPDFGSEIFVNCKVKGE